MTSEAVKVNAAVLESYWETHRDPDGMCDEGCPFCQNKQLAKAYGLATEAVCADEVTLKVLPSSQSRSVALANRCVDLKREVVKLEAELKVKKKLLEVLLLKAPEVFARDGLKRVPLKSGPEVSYRRNLWISKREEVDKDQFLGALERADMGHCVISTYVPISIQSHVRELEKEGLKKRRDGDWREAIKEEVGEELFEMLNVTEQVKGFIRNLGKEEDDHHG